MEVNNRGVQNNLLCTINPLHFLYTHLLEGPVICDGLGGKKRAEALAQAWERTANAKAVGKHVCFVKKKKNSDFAGLCCSLLAVKPVETRAQPEGLLGDEGESWRKHETDRVLNTEGKNWFNSTKKQRVDLMRRSTLTPAGEAYSFYFLILEKCN